MTYAKARKKSVVTATLGGAGLDFKREALRTSISRSRSRRQSPEPLNTLKVTDGQQVPVDRSSFAGVGKRLPCHKTENCDLGR